jgi:putative MFS transporter
MLLFPFIFTVIICLSAIFLQESPRELFFGKQAYLQGAESFKKINEFNRDVSNNNKFDFGDPDIEKATKNIQIEMSNVNSGKESSNNLQDIKSKDDNMKGGLLNNESQSHSSLLKMSRFKQLFSEDYFKYTILFWILGAFSGFIFYGIHFMLPATAPKINKNTFLDLVLFESMEIPPNFFAMLLIENKGIGRKNTIRIGFVVTFLISLTNVYLGETILLFDCLLKFALTIPLNILFVYSSEIYDSHVRTLGLSLMNFWKKISSLFSPFFMSYVVYKYGEFSTHLTYAPLLAICAFGSLFLTIETRGRALDEIIILDK